MNTKADDLAFEYLAEMREEWVPVPGFTTYMISSFGRIRSLSEIGSRRNGIIMSPGLSNGYLVIGMYKDRRLYRRAIHRTVCEAFNGPGKPGQYACHNDDSRLNNRASNLRWDSPKGNAFDVGKNGLRLSGPDCATAKIDAAAVSDIRDGSRVTSWYANKYWISDVSVRNVQRRRTHKNLP